MLTSQQILQRLKTELKRQKEAWARHEGQYDCKIDGTCLPRARYQARTATLEFVIEIVKGRKPELLSIDD